ncbi:acyltransferase [Amycolatopsis ultiminotia]|uniref:acyltransferase family protein n=1 Tax=Amycolatopsis ultiminotia TaxID=543629 RepID=UPI0031EE1A61
MPAGQVTAEQATTAGPVEAPAPTSSRQVSWDAIRVLAIFAVLAYHITCLAPLTLPGLPPLQPWLQMDFPFGSATLIVVSGFFAATTVGRSTPLRWWLRRLARMLPAFWVAVLVIFTVSRLFAPDDFVRPDFGDLIGNLLLAHLLLPGVDYIDLAHWTVPVQVAAFTMIALLARRGRIRGHLASAVLWFVLLAPLAVRVLFMNPDVPAPAWLSAIMDGTGLNRAHLVIAGVSIFRWSRGRIGFPQLFLMLCVVLWAHTVHPPGGDSVQMFTLALVLVCVAAYRPAWNVRILNRLAKPIQWLAGISYGVYLMHYTIGTIVARRLADLGLAWWVWVPAFFASAVLLGWALTRWVERPAFKLLTVPQRERLSLRT